MRKVIKKLMTWTKEARVGLLFGVIALMIVGGLTFARTWWNKTDPSSVNTPSGPSNSSVIPSSVDTTPSSNTPVVLPLEEKLRRPYSATVTVARGFYDLESSLEDQAAAIVYYDGKYLPSYGVDYVCTDGSFDIIAASSGMVSEIIADPIYGLTVTVESVGNIKVIYASLESCPLQVGASVSIGDAIGSAGESVYGSELNSEFLHFELYKNNTVLNPEEFFGKMLKDIN